MTRNEVALVDEGRCIGCTLCISACPVDAIVGARTLMHTIVEPWCIGCRLCVPPCPVDCISMVKAPPWPSHQKSSVKARAKSRKLRIAARIIPVSTIDRRAALAAALAGKKRP